MSDLLNILWTHPLEREYEGWVAREIEDYFTSVGRAAKIFAVSPVTEKKWPADEELSAFYKVVGLQLKRPYLRGNDPAPQNLYWKLGRRTGAAQQKPSGVSGRRKRSAVTPSQFEGIGASKSIVYCLPTFLNQGYRRASLPHCLFWHPDDPETPDWDNNPASATIEVDYASIKQAQRWGYFVEALIACDRGVPVKTRLQWTKVLEEIRSSSMAILSSRSGSTSPTNPTVTDASADGGRALILLAMRLTDDEARLAEAATAGRTP